jgi:hypothetical protein
MTFVAPAAPLLIILSELNTNVIVIPVAKGSTKNALPKSFIPAILSASRASAAHNLFAALLPHALGCSAVTSPLRPIPCAIPYDL